MTRDPLARIRRRPDPVDWADDDKLTLREAVALFYPDGPITVPTLRTAISRGELTPFAFAGKHWVTPAQMRALFRPRECHDAAKARGSISAPGGFTPGPASPSPTSITSETDRLRSAQDAVQMRLAQLRKPSPTTSSRSGRRGPRKSTIPTAPVIHLRSSSPRS